MVFVTTGDSYSDPVAETSDAFVAFDLKTGKLLWSRQMTSGDAFTVDCDFPEQSERTVPTANGPDFDFGSSAVLVNLATASARSSPARNRASCTRSIPIMEGEILWQRKIGQGGRIGGIQWGIPRTATTSTPRVSDVPMTAPLPDGAGGRPTIFGIPLMLNPEAGGGLYALDLETGEIAWKTPHPVATNARLQPGAISRNDGRFLASSSPAASMAT